MTTTKVFEAVTEHPVRAVAALAAATILFRIGVLVEVAYTEPERLVRPDSPSYLQPARALLATGSYAETPSRPSDPETVRTPGYPLFLAAVIGLGGSVPIGVAAAQALLAGCTLLLVFGIGREVGDTTTGLLAAALYASDLVVFTHDVFLLFTFLLAGSVLALIRLLRSGVRWWAVGAGALLAAATLTRPILYYFLPLAVIGVFAWTWRRTRLVAAASQAALFLAPMLLLVGGWQVRNARLTGNSAVSHLVGTNLLFYRAAGVVARRDGITVDSARTALGYGRERGPAAGTSAPSRAELDERWRQKGLEILADHPVGTLEVGMAGMATTLFAPGMGTTGALMGTVRPASVQRAVGSVLDLSTLRASDRVLSWLREQPAVALAAGWAAFHLLLLYAGLGLRLLRSSDEQWLSGEIVLLIVAGYLLLMSAGPEANSRFRVPMVPALAVLSARGWLPILRRGLLRDDAHSEDASRTASSQSRPADAPTSPTDD